MTSFMRYCAVTGVVSAVFGCSQIDETHLNGDRGGQSGARDARVIVAADVTSNGAWFTAVSGDEPSAVCAQFRLTPADVTEFFEQARLVSERVYAHDLDMSRCHSAGRVVLGDGTTAAWQIDRERRGRLTLADGRSFYFHCLACTAAAFSPP